MMHKWNKSFLIYKLVIIIRSIEIYDMIHWSNCEKRILCMVWDYFTYVIVNKVIKVTNLLRDQKTFFTPKTKTWWGTKKKTLSSLVWKKFLIPHQIWDYFTCTWRTKNLFTRETKTFNFKKRKLLSWAW